MKDRLTHLLLLCTLAATAGVVSPAWAQQFSIGADLVSRYVWRGTDFGESVTIQPALAVAHKGFELGTWASYAASPQSAGDNEHDLWLSFSAGNVTLGVTDYYFPNAGPGFFNFDNHGTGGHAIEPFVGITGPASFPVELFAGYFAYNDPDNSLYLAATYPFAVDGVDLSFTVGASGGRSALYGTNQFGIIELNLAAGKSIPITDHFSLPVTVAYLLNPYAERSFLVFGLSF